MRWTVGGSGLAASVALAMLSQLILQATLVHTVRSAFLCFEQLSLMCSAGPRSYAQRRFDSPDIINKKAGGPFVTMRQTKHGQAL